MPREGESINILGDKRPISNEYWPHCWSDLPNDILVPILESLSFLDQLRARDVCKNWRLATRGIKHDVRFPWLFLFKDWRYSPEPDYNVLYDPSSGEEYYVENTPEYHSCKRRFIGRIREYLLTREILAVKSGWVLTRELCPCGLIFLYSPFLQEVVEVPELPTSIPFPVNEGKFTFSYCSECLSFVVYGAVLTRHGLISLITWRSGGQIWEHDYFRAKLPDWGGAISNDVYKLELIKGTLYCVFHTGTVATLEFGSEVNYYCAAVNHENDRLFDTRIRPEVVVCEDELFMVYRNAEGETQIWRLDWSWKAWIKEVCLDKRVLFLGSNGYSRSLMLPVGKNSEDLAGRVYVNRFDYRYDRFYDCHFRVYNEAANELAPASFPLPSNGSVLEYYPVGYEAPCAIWIEPPNL